MLGLRGDRELQLGNEVRKSRSTFPSAPRLVSRPSGGDQLRVSLLSLLHTATGCTDTHIVFRIFSPLFYPRQ